MRTAQDITKALGGKWYGRYGTAPCPVCQQDADKSHNALTISDGDFRLLMHCKKSNCAFKDLAVACGLAWQRSNPSSAQSNAARRLPKPTYDHYARKAWHEGRSIIGTPAETYLREARGLEGPYPGQLAISSFSLAWSPASQSARHDRTYRRGLGLLDQSDVPPP